MRESLRKKEFTPSLDFIEKIALDVVTRANLGTDIGIAQRLNYYAGLPQGSRSEFELTKSVSSEDAIDIVTRDGEKMKVAFTLGPGITSVYFVNTNAVEDEMIYKSKKYVEIGNFDELAATINGFIRLEPKEGEIIDTSKKALQERMLRHTNKPPVATIFLNSGFRKR
ncbi:MAG: hypothetical protein UU16_C0057G0005 [Candidatus Woesebacteria bacterium GW2011_GWA2_40_7]|uniref:Uncharacterized protein n=3 Tax=Candidatus Woeseibacteriota TaxID=1752722 RepID=A0A0G0UUF3_9BACT|nr:MAG: hypothetical protein UT17_C0001G0142 [Candidatus Woesebacteria bacterium GW2011_GWB1_39_10]KKR71639.1 MAG: hypothetical protein UU16_C0057G0005 [Candidatus Woesebacteria bacterium GW2011_GWA2_40_7]KKR92328.1 MAG: hypothetical protein UU42_C0002G0142 [Candidatus Woesebacteria bacterium GW2011_GWA1_41_13b]